MDEEAFGPYRMEELIGQGGMGEVHRAYDTVRNRSVAVKRLPVALAADPKFRARFRAEAALVATFTEPHIIPIHDFGEIDGRLFIDMRLVDGEDLGALLARHGPLPPARAVNIVGQVAAALDAAHAEFLVHRDIKPANVLITGPGGGDGFVYVADFGIARAVSGGSVSLTATGTAVGSVDYMAPERFGDGHGDHRVDVYALGCLLFEALTALRPFAVDGLPAIINAHLNVEPPRPSQHEPGVPVALDEVVSRAMAKEPDSRYQSAGELASAALAALDVPTGPVAATTSTGVRLPTRDTDGGPARRRRRRGPLVLAVLALILAIVGGGTFALGLGDQAGADEIVQEPRGTPGDNPFMPPVGTDRSDVTPPPGSGGRFEGGTSGLYGGTRDNAACDPDAMSAFLEGNPGQASAWAQVQGITPDQIPSYVAGLTPLVVRSDTAVTNHGFADGRATPFPAILQAGTAVLVDEFGVPRAKCYCGNPLTPPVSSPEPRYVGRSWSGFSPAAVTTITPAAAPIMEFTVVDPATDEVFHRPAGGTGNDRADDRTTSSPTAQDPTAQDPTAQDPTTPFTSDPVTPAETPDPITSSGSTAPVITDAEPPPAVVPDVPLPPAAPTGLTATATGPDTIELSWTGDFDSDTFFEVSDGPFSRSVPDSGSSYTWSGLEPGTRSCFQVTAYNPAGASAPSAEACATTVPTPPAASSDLAPTGISPDSAVPAVGSPVFFDSGISNSGNEATRDFSIKWFVDGREVGAYGGHAGLPPDTVVSDGNSQFTWTFDQPGSYRVTFTVDADDHVAESDEGNNSTSIDVTVG